jgi:hypothetical protein
MCVRQEKRAMTYPHRLLDDIDTLASFQGWSKEVYEEFFKLREGDIDEDTFRKRHCRSVPHCRYCRIMAPT